MRNGVNYEMLMVIFIMVIVDEKLTTQFFFSDKYSLLSCIYEVVWC